MALLSDQQHNRLLAVPPADLLVGFPARGAAGGKVDVLVENDGYRIRRHFSEFML